MTWLPRPPPLFAQHPTRYCADRRPQLDQINWPGPIRVEAPVDGQWYQGKPIPRPGQTFPPLSLEGQQWFDREWSALRLILSDEPSLGPTIAKLDEIAEGRPFIATQTWAEPHARGSTLQADEYLQPVGGRPATKVDRWKALFTSKASKKLLARHDMQQRVPYSNPPSQGQLGPARPPPVATPDQYESMMDEVVSSITEGIRFPVRLDDPIPPDHQTHWNLFPVTDPSGKIRWCSDGSKGNEFINHLPFKERGGWKSLRNTGSHRDLMIGWDVRKMFQIWMVRPSDAAREQILIPASVIKEAYFRMDQPFTPSDYRVTVVRGTECYSLRNITCSFGNTASPRLARDHYTPVLAWLRRMGIRCTIKTDDGRSLSRYGLALMYAQMLVVIAVHAWLGIPIHLKGQKSHELWPHTKSGFDGHWFDLATETVFSLAKNDTRHCTDMAVLLDRWETNQPITLRQLSSAKSAHASHDTFWPTPLLVQPLATAITLCMRRMRTAGIDFDHQWDTIIHSFISLTDDIRQACRALTTPKRVGTWFRVVPQPVITVIADTSMTGCGGRVTNHQDGSVHLTQHFLDDRQRALHHTHMELEGIIDVTLAAIRHLDISTRTNALGAVDMGTDNGAAETNIGRPGNKEHMVYPILQLWLCLRSMNLIPRAFRVPKLIHDEVLLTDWMGRWLAHSQTWGLTKQVVHEAMMRLFGHPLDPDTATDLFACATTRQVPRYFSRYMDKRAVATDALRQPWPRHGQLWIFPPEMLLPQVVHRLLEQQLPAVLVFPLYSINQEFWPDLREMLDAVFPIPFNISNFVVPDGTQPATANQTTRSTLIVAALSPRSWRTRDFPTPVTSSAASRRTTPTVRLVLPNKWEVLGPVSRLSPDRILELQKSLGTC